MTTDLFTWSVILIVGAILVVVVAIALYARGIEVAHQPRLI